jgi:HTH-like domain/Integrase core domain
MSANQASFPIAAMARVLGVSKAGYYAWLQRPPSAHATADAASLKRIKTVHASLRQTYGAPRVHADLCGRGERHSRKRIARLMREAGLVGASHRHGGPTTTRRNKDDRPAPDLVDRDFSATRPNQLWVADITYVPTMAGFLYLAVVLDAWSRKIVGWAMANHLRAELCWTRRRWRLANGGPRTSSTTAPRKLRPWRPPSTPGGERRLIGKHQQRRLTNCFCRRTKMVLRRLLEAAQYTSVAFGKRCGAICCSN